MSSFGTALGLTIFHYFDPIINLYAHFYSKELLEDLKDPFDFIFEQQISFDDIQSRKREVLGR